MGRYVIEYYDGCTNGLVSYDNEPCNSLDFAMTFETEDEAKRECEKLQKEWKSELRISFVE